MGDLVKLTDKGRPTAFRLQRFTLARLFRAARDEAGRDGTAEGGAAGAQNGGPTQASVTGATRASAPVVRQLALFGAAMALVLVLAIIAGQSLGSRAPAASSDRMLDGPAAAESELPTLAASMSLAPTTSSPATLEAAPPAAARPTPQRPRAARVQPTPAPQASSPDPPLLPY